MRIAVLGATGRIGRYTLSTLKRSGHETVPISRSTGVDAYTSAGLDEALAGVDVVVDVCNTRSQDEAQIVDFFGTVTGNLLAAEDRVGVGHHVLLSVVGINHDQHGPITPANANRSGGSWPDRSHGASSARRSSTTSRRWSPDGRS